jgi:hypothetical protein
MRLLLGLLPMMLSTAWAQDDDPFSNVNFDDLFGGSFESADLFSGSTSPPRHFRVQLSQQLSAHLNRHRVNLPDGSSRQRSHGVETSRLGINVRYQNPFATGWLLQGSAQARGWLPGDYDYHKPDRDNSEWRLNELFVQRSDARHSVSFGRQTIVWGETVGNSVLDVINTTEYRDLSIIDIEDARLNQWLLVWDMFSERGNWSSFVNLYPEFDPVPVTGSPLYPQAQQVAGMPLRLGYYRRKEAIFEAGTRWSRSYTGSDVAVMAAWLYENRLRHMLPAALEASGGVLRAQAQINDHGLLGLSVNRAIGRLLLTLDLAYSHGVLSDSITSVALPDVGMMPVPELVRRNRMALSAGLEYGLSPTQQLSMSVAAQQDHGAAGTTRGNVLMRYSNSLRNDELMLSATLQSQLDAEAVLLFLGADWRLSDAWELGTQLVFTRADIRNPLYFLDQDVRAGLILTWNF